VLDTQPDATPSGILTVADLQERSRNHAHESQILLSGVMKSVTVGNAAYTLVMLAGSSVSPLLWIPFWIDTFATIIVSFTQQITGSLLSTFVPDWHETTIVFSEALWEFMMMSTLMPRGSRLPMLSSWYVVAGLHAVFGVLAMQNLRSKLASGRYSPALGGLVESFRAGLRRNMPFAGAGAAIVFSAGIATRYLVPRFPALERWQVIVPLAILANVIIVIRAMDRDRSRILTFFRTHSGQ
jgi:hypothetical protein